MLDPRRFRRWVAGRDADQLTEPDLADRPPVARVAPHALTAAEKDEILKAAAELDSCSRKILDRYYGPEKTSSSVQTAWDKALAAEGLYAEEAEHMPAAFSDPGTPMTSKVDPPVLHRAGGDPDLLQTPHPGGQCPLRGLDGHHQLRAAPARLDASRRCLCQGLAELRRSSRRLMCTVSQSGVDNPSDPIKA